MSRKKSIFEFLIKMIEADVETVCASVEDKGQCIISVLDKYMRAIEKGIEYFFEEFLGVDDAGLDRDEAESLAEELKDVIALSRSHWALLTGSRTGKGIYNRRVLK